MSIDLDPQRVAPPASGDPAPTTPIPVVPATPEPPRMPGRRNPRWIALGIVSLCLGGLLSYAIYAQVATETTVVAMKDTVYRGQAIKADDLTTIVIQGHALASAVPSSRMNDLVDHHAVFDLPKGSVVLADSVSDVAVPQDGSAIVGLKLTSGQAPSTMMTPASPVRLVALPPSGPDGTAGDKLAGKTYLAHVIDSTPDADGTSVVVNVEVDGQQAPTIALLAAQNRLAVVRDPGK